jgi:5-methylcytosine-specific restriction endonuclease McrBC regulatory subunit McrC
LQEQFELRIVKQLRQQQQERERSLILFFSRITPFHNFRQRFRKLRIGAGLVGATQPHL